MADPTATPKPKDDIDKVIDSILNSPAGGKATPTKTPTPRRDLQGYEESELRILWRAGRITEDQWKQELVARGANAQSAADQIAVQKNTGVSVDAKTKGQLTAGEQAKVDAIKSATQAPPADASASKPAADFDSWENPTLAAQGRSSITGAQSPSAAGARGPDGRTVQEIRGTDYKSDAERQWYLSQTSGSPSGSGPLTSAVNTARATSSGSSSGGRSGSGGGGSGGSAAAPKAEPVVIPNSAEDLRNRGGLQVGQNFTMNGRQQRRMGEVRQGVDEKWYVVTGDQISGPYKSQTEANANNVYSDTGAAATSKSGVSPLAGYSATSGVGMPQLENQSDTVSMDQIIQASATKGAQRGDHIATLRPGMGLKPMDVTSGGIAEYGGLRPVTDGMGNPSMFTGRAPGNLGVGMSSMAGRADTGAQIQQMLGIPSKAILSQIEKIAADPAATLRLQQFVDTARAEGRMPNFSDLAARYDNDLSGQNIKVSSGNNKFRQTLAEFLAEAGIPDMEFMPDPYEPPAEPLIFNNGGVIEEEPKSSPFIIGAPNQVRAADPYKSGWPEPATMPASGQPRIIPLQAGEYGAMLDAETQGVYINPLDPAYQRHRRNIRAQNPLWNEAQINTAAAQMIEAERLSTSGPDIPERKFHFWRDDPELGDGRYAPMSYAERDAQAMGWMNEYGNRPMTVQGFTGGGVPPTNTSVTEMDLYHRGGLQGFESYTGNDMSNMLGTPRGGLSGIPRIRATGGSVMTDGPAVTIDMDTGKPLAVMGGGPAPEKLSVTPTGTPAQQQQAAVQESAIARMMGGWRPRQPMPPRMIGKPVRTGGFRPMPLGAGL